MIRRASEFGPPPSGLELPIEVDPLKPSRNAMEIFILLLSIWAGVRLALGIEVGETGVGPFFSYTWRVLIILGPMAVLVGMVWRGQSYTANVQQELGYLSISIAAWAYGVAAMDGIIVLFGCFTFWRAMQLSTKLEIVFPGSSQLHRIWRGVKRLWKKVYYRA